MREDGTYLSTMQRYDVAILSDLRGMGGSATAIGEEIKANAGAGYTTGLINLRSPTQPPARPVNPRIRRLINAGLATLADPTAEIAAALVAVFHPPVLTNLPTRPMRIHGSHKLLVATHPPFDAYGQPNYDLARVDANAQS